MKQYHYYYDYFKYGRIYYFGSLYFFKKYRYNKNGIK